MRRVNVQLIVSLVILAVLSTVAQAPPKTGKAVNDALKSRFEDRKVKLKTDMPRSGISIWPEKQPPLIVKIGSQQASSFKITLFDRDTPVITKVAVVKNRIELYLDEGGYDPAVDVAPHVSQKPVYPSKSRWQISLEGLLAAARKAGKTETIADLEAKIARLNAERQRIYDAEMRKYTREKIAHDDWVRGKQSEKGSRFYIRFKTVPEITPEKVIEWLAAYVDFSLPNQPSDIISPPYRGHWRNSRGEALNIDERQIAYDSGVLTGYTELFRLATEKLFVVETTKDLTGKCRFILMKMTEPGMTIYLFETRKDLENGTNKRGEEMWTRR